MEIVTTREELAAAVGTSSFGYVSLARKQNSLNLHEGHAYVINYSKANFDKTVVGFWHGLELLYALYGIDYFGEDDGSVWDETGCLSWVESLGVDYALVPPLGYSATYLTQLGIQLNFQDPVVHAWVEQVWQDNNYPNNQGTIVDRSLYNTTLRAKAFIIMQHHKNKLNQTCVASWKDGYPLFTMAHYVNNYTTENFTLLDPIKNADNMYFSSVSDTFTPEEINTISQFEGVVNGVGYYDENTLRAALMSLSPALYVRRVDTTIGGVVGAANDFINIQFDINGKSDSYPIYKKGVR